LPMRALSKLTIILFVASLACADTIYLRSGISIQASQVREVGDNVEYVVGSTKYTIPKSSIWKIERPTDMKISVGGSSAPFNNITVQQVRPGEWVKGGIDAAPAGSMNDVPAPVPLPESMLQGFKEDPMLQRIVTAGRVDDGAISAIEREGNPENIQKAYLLASVFEVSRGEPKHAAEYGQTLVQKFPEDAGLHGFYSSVLLFAGNYRTAISEAQKAADGGLENHWYPHLVKGAAYYKLGDTQKALESWKRAQALRPNEELASSIARLEREHSVQKDFNQQESAHFTIYYQGRATALGLQSDILQTLERDYSDLASQLRYWPEENISVLLYTQKAFFDVTESPAWAGGVNDGKLRIPIEGLTQLTPELARVLKHELVHSFVAFMTHQRCPTWLHEGLAQMLEPESSEGDRAFLRAVYAANKQMPFRALEGSFMGLSPVQAHLAYVQSLAAVELLRDNQGMSGLQRLLEALNSGQPPETALAQVNRLNYKQLDQELADKFTGQ
jgi:tetratricopeptide (TPR) repeat protein